MTLYAIRQYADPTSVYPFTAMIMGTLADAEKRAKEFVDRHENAVALVCDNDGILSEWSRS